MFLNTREEFSDSEADAVIEMKVEEDTEAAVRRAVDGCVKVLGLESPEESKIQEAIKAIEEYKPSIKKSDDRKKTREQARYYGLLAEVDLTEALSKKLASMANASGPEGDAVGFWNAMKSAGRVTQRPHVTFIHRNSLPAEETLWTDCATLHAMKQPPLFRIQLGHLVWNSRVMALTVDKLNAVGEEGAHDEATVERGKQFLASLPEELTKRLHITVGTINAEAKPVEAKALVEAFRKGETSDASGPIKSISLDDVFASGRIKALNN